MSHETGPTIMMLTSAGHHGDSARCRELGIGAYLTKPINAAELRAAVAHLLRGAVQARREAGHPRDDAGGRRAGPGR
jgi:DNA-binding response OmpR family regulator